MLDSVIRENKKYYPQTLVEECKYEIKNISISNISNIYFFHILSLYFFLFQMIFHTYFLLSLFILLCCFHYIYLLYLTSFLFFFDNKLFHSSFSYIKKSIMIHLFFKSDISILFVASSLLIYQK